MIVLWTGKFHAAIACDWEVCLCRLQRTQDLTAALAQILVTAFSVCQSVYLRRVSTGILRYGFLSICSVSVKNEKAC